MPFWKTDWFKKVRNGGETICFENVGRNNKLGEDGAKEVARALEDPQTKCKKLILEGNHIGPEGATAIATALKTNSTLTTLKLGWERIQDEGVFSIASALQSNAVLTTLSLISNEIGNGGAMAIARALETNVTLTTLDLSYNDIGFQGAEAIATALQSNVTLASLDLGHNDNIDNDMRSQIGSFLKPDNRQKRAEEIAQQRSLEEHENEERRRLLVAELKEELERRYLSILSNDELLVCIETINLERLEAAKRVQREMTDEAIAILENIETTLAVLRQLAENRAFVTLQDLESEAPKEDLKSVESRIEAALQNSDYNALRELRTEKAGIERVMLDVQIAYEKACESYQARKEELDRINNKKQQGKDASANANAPEPAGKIPTKESPSVSHSRPSTGQSSAIDESNIMDTESQIGVEQHLPQVRSPSVFLSHAGVDSGVFASHLHQNLLYHNFTSFFDAGPGSIMIGEHWENKIDREASTCDIFLCLYSEHYCRRRWCMRELALAFESKRRILPVFLNGAEPPNNPGYNSFSGPKSNMSKVSEEDLQRYSLHLIRLSKIQAIRRDLSRPGNSKYAEVELINTIIDELKRLVEVGHS